MSHCQRKSTCFTTTVLLCASLGSSLPCVAAIPVEYIGEFCWQTIPDNQNDNPFVLQLAVTYVGGVHYSLQGAGYPAANPNALSLVNGNGMLSGNEVLLSLVNPGINPETGEHWLDGITVRLDAESLNGRYSVIDHWIEPAEFGSLISTEIIGGKAIKVNCPSS